VRTSVDTQLASTQENNRYTLPNINNVALMSKVQQGFIVSRFLETTKPCIVIVLHDSDLDAYNVFNGTNVNSP